MCVQGVQEWAEKAALRGTSVRIRGDEVLFAHSDHLTSACQEVQDPACTEICSVPESGASQPVWQALWVLNGEL